ncbi:MAG: hypothetical protein KDI51_00355 [Xanthomonadales bacterium]|nr:hypothetical protein [Xanthomonadales bacterium]
MGLLLGSAALASAGQPGPYAIHQYGIEQGLSHNAVLALAQDGQGFVWLATQDGLDRFDGRQVEPFDELAGRSLRGGAVRFLQHDGGDGLWIGLLNNGLLHRQASGQVAWAGLPGVDEKPVTLTAMLADSPWLWMGSTDSLLRLPLNGEGPIERVLSAGEVRALARSDTALWVLLRDGDCRLLRIDPMNLQRLDERVAPCLGSLSLVDDERLAMAANRVWSLDQPPPAIERDATAPPLVSLNWRDGTVLGGVDGAFWRDRSGASVRLWPPAQRVRTGRPDESVLAALVDRDDALWLATYGGVIRLDPGALIQHRLGDGTGLAQALVDRHVAALLQHDQDWWIGSFGDGLLRWTDVSMPAMETEVPADCGELDWSLLEHPEGVLRNGRCLFDARGLRWQIDDDGDAAIARGALQAADGRIWLASGSGLRQLQQRRSVVVAHGAFEAIAEDGQGQLWLGKEIVPDQRGQALWRYDPDQDQLHAFALPQPADVYDLLAVGEQVWIASSLGLYALDPARQQWQLHLPRQQRAGHVIYSLISDANGLLWLGTNRGLLRFDPAANETAFTHYDQRDGLAVTEFNRRSRAHDKQGRLLFGGAGGVIVIEPASALRAPALRAPQLLAIGSIDGQGRTHDLPLSDQIKVGADSVALTMAWTTPQFDRVQHLQHRYRLHGIDPDWVGGSELDSARYPRLPPGQYRFAVQAGDSASGRWGPALEREVRVLPPWYRQGWFLLLCAVLLLAAATLIYRLRIAHLLALERVRLRIAADLHDELGSELAAIGMSADLLHRRGPSTAPDRLTELADAARRASESVRDVVWYVNPDKDSLADLGLRLQVLAQRLFAESKLSVDNGWRDDPRPLPMQQRRDLHLFCREAFTNILRHAAATRVELRLWQRDGELGIDLSDDGCGFDPGAPQAGSGVDGLRRRAQALAAELQIDSAIGQGTRIRLRMTHRRPARWLPWLR